MNFSPQMFWWLTWFSWRHVCLYSWSWITGFGFLGLDSLFWVPGLYVFGWDSWVWILEFGVLGLDSWIWTLDSWIWTPGLNLLPEVIKPTTFSSKLQIMRSPSRKPVGFSGNPARKPISFYKPFISWRTHCKLHSRGRVDWGRLRESPLILHTRADWVRTLLGKPSEGMTFRLRCPQECI